MCMSDFVLDTNYIITDIDSSIRKRVMDIGIINGTIIKRVLLNNPSAYFYRGIVMAIRKDDALKIKGILYE